MFWLKKIDRHHTVYKEYILLIKSFFKDVCSSLVAHIGRSNCGSTPGILPHNVLKVKVSGGRANPPQPWLGTKKELIFFFFLMFIFNFSDLDRDVGQADAVCHQLFHRQPHTSVIVFTCYTLQHRIGYTSTYTLGQNVLVTIHPCNTISLWVFVDFLFGKKISSSKSQYPSVRVRTSMSHQTM